MLRKLAILATLYAAPALPVRAEVFDLTNGDRLTGEIVGWEGNTVTIRNPLLGSVTVPLEAFVDPPLPPPGQGVATDPETLLSEAATTSNPSGTPPDGPTVVAVPVAPKASPAPAGPDPIDQARAPEKPRAADAEQTAPAQEFVLLPVQVYRVWHEMWLDNPFFRTLGRLYPLMSWKNQLDIGLTLQMAERDEQKLDLQFNTEKRFDRHFVRLESRYQFASANDGAGVQSTTTDRLRGNLRYRYDYVEDFFIQSRTSYQRDVVKQIYQELGESIGIGYRWLNRDRLNGSLTPSLGAGYRQIAANPGSWEWLASLQQDFEFKLSDHLRVSQESSLNYSPTENGDYYFTFQAALENRLSDALSLNLRYDLTYDERVASAVEPTTQGVSLTLGARF